MTLPIFTAEIRHEYDAFRVRQRAREIAALLGFEAQDQTCIATAVSEIAHNAVRDTGGGKVAFGLGGEVPRLFQVHITDQGPATADLDRVSDGGPSLRAQREISLHCAQRLVDTFLVEPTPAGGTAVTLGKRIPGRAPAIGVEAALQITEALTRQVHEDPVEEILHQNRELLLALNELRARQEELERSNTGMVALYAELDARKQLFRKSEERFRLMVEDVRDYAIFLLDTTGRVASWNVGAERILGWQEMEVLGQPWARFFTPEDRQRGAPDREVLTARHQGRTEDERWHVRKDDSRFWSSGVLTALRDEGGKLIGYVKILRDYTERRRSDEQRAQHMVEIEALNARLQRSMRETHHRVKNNLQVITALVDMQLGDGAEMLPASVLRRVGQHVKTLASIHDLLTRGASIGLDVESISAKEVLEQLVPMIQATAGGRSIRYQVEDVPLTLRHAASLSILVNELLSNALKHGRGEMALTFAVTDATALLQVCDDGPGFPEGFEPHQAANTGMELIDSLTRHDLSGEVLYENRAEGGACVKLCFPTCVASRTAET